MLNQVSVCGIVKDTSQNNGDDYVLLEVKRSFKGFDKKFERDLIRCKIWKGAKSKTTLSYSKGMIISVAGRLYSEDGKSYYIDAYEIELIG